MSIPSVVAYVESGQPTESLKLLVRHACNYRSVLPPVLPLEHEGVTYCLRLPAAKDASPDGDALQAFEWASNPPGMVVQKMHAQPKRQASAAAASVLCQLPGSTKLRRRGCCVNRLHLKVTASRAKDAAGKQLLPVALPTDTQALIFLADAIADYNRNLGEDHADPSGDSTTFSEDCLVPSGTDTAWGLQLRLTPWLGTSLAPIGAAVTIQSHWRGWVTRQRVGHLGQQLLHRRAAVCIQRAWRVYLFRQRMKMLHAVSVSAKAIASMHATERACLLHHHYLEAFRLQQQEQQGKGRPRCFPEHDIRFAFEEGGMIFGVNRPGVDRSGIPLWTGVSLPVVDEEDMEPLGAEQLYDASECAQLLTHTTTVEKTRRSPTGGAGEGADWVIIGLDPACPEPDSELQMRAAVLLALTWDIKTQSGIRLSVRPASFVFSPSLAAQEISFQVPICATPVPVGEASEALDRVRNALADCDCSATSALQWRPRPERFAVRVSQLRKLGILPNGTAPTVSDPSTNPEACPGLEFEHSEAASSASGPSSPWPTPAQLKQTLAAFGRAQAEETAHTLASRDAFDALIKKMHVASLQSQPAASQPRSCATGHAFAPATARVPTVAEAMAMTQQLRHSEQAVCQEAAQKARQRHVEASQAAKHTLKTALYWKGAFGRAHSSLTKSALKQVHEAHRDANHGLVNMGHGRQAKGKRDRYEKELMGNYHGQLNMLKAFILKTDLQHRHKLEADAAWAAVLEERKSDAQRQAHIQNQQLASQHAKHAAGEGVRAVPAMAGKKRLDILYELQDVVDRRRNEEIDSLEKTAPSGGVWGSQQQPPWWNVLRLTMVGSVSDPEITDLITTVNDSGFWAGKEQADEMVPEEQAQQAASVYASRTSTSGRCSGCREEYYCSPQCQKQAWPRHEPSCKTMSTGFQFSGSTRPLSLGTQ